VREIGLEYISDFLFLDKPFHFCPGCGHGIIVRILAEAIHELGIREKAIMVTGAGCGTLVDQYMNLDTFDALHGRAPSVATGLKLAQPEKVIFTYQGDGDVASIGIGEIIRAANRGISITAIMVNNGMYGMTGGQMGATTLLGQKTSTTPSGRKADLHGFPLRVPELFQNLEGTAFVARMTVSSPKGVIRVKKSIKKAFECQLKDLGFSYVEILSPCVTGIKKSPVDAMTWVKEEMESYYPVGIIKSHEEI
jgi:2-oxoglutarate ferredoxin oxidoreductase subunit beta